VYVLKIVKNTYKSVFSNLSAKEKEPYLKQAYDLFLNIFPLADIDNIEIRKLCRQFRRKEKCKKNVVAKFQQYEEYFWNWTKNNQMIDLFYFRR
jgi:hypothetical protein